MKNLNYKHGLIFKRRDMQRHDDDPEFISFDIDIPKCEECGYKFQDKYEVRFLTNVIHEDNEVLYMPLCADCAYCEITEIVEEEEPL